MLKKITLFALLSAAFTAHAGLETMSPQELTDAVGQGGADELDVIIKSSVCHRYDEKCDFCPRWQW